MKLFGVLLLVGLTYAAPTSKEDDKLIITEEFFPDKLAVYTSQHDIINIYVPFNALNFNENSDETSGDTTESILFFVEGDIKENGEVESKGLYILRNGTATKLLDNGRDIAAELDNSETVYFGAKDGIYVYNSEKNTAEKYGSVTDSVINIAKENGTDVLYILTENKELYKVTEQGNKKVKIDDVVGAEQIVMDLSNNLYYYGADKVPHVINANGSRKFEGLPANPAKVTLIKPPFILDDSVPVVIDNVVYIIYANGTVENSNIELQVTPSAYSAEATLIQYYGHNKKIYEYNILVVLMGTLLEEVGKFLDEMKDTIESIATKSRVQHSQLMK